MGCGGGAVSGCAAARRPGGDGHDGRAGLDRHAYLGGCRRAADRRAHGRRGHHGLDSDPYVRSNVQLIKLRLAYTSEQPLRRCAANKSVGADGSQIPLRVHTSECTTRATLQKQKYTHERLSCAKSPHVSPGVVCVGAAPPPKAPKSIRADPGAGGGAGAAAAVVPMGEASNVAQKLPGSLAAAVVVVAAAAPPPLLLLRLEDGRIGSHGVDSVRTSSNSVANGVNIREGVEAI